MRRRRIQLAATRMRENHGAGTVLPLMVSVCMFTAAAVFLPEGCGRSEKAGRATAAGKIRVVATTGMIGDAVRVIAGDHVVLNSLMGPGVDPHLYRAAKGDLDLLHEADLVFYNGLNLEAKMADVLKKMGRTKTTIAVGQSVPDTLLRYPDGPGGHPDPHIWFDVSLWMMVVDEIGQQLASKDPTNAEFYLRTTQSYLDTLEALHVWVADRLATIPEKQRVLVTAHDAFEYFGQAYHTEVEGLQGISTVSEAGLYDVTKMVDMLVKRDIKAVFVESSVPRKAINAVVDGCRSKGHEVTIGGVLFSDAMGKHGTAEGTYVGMVRQNVTTIVEALE